MGKTLFFIFLSGLVTAMIWLGLRDQPDPVWQKSEQLLRQDFLMLDDAADSVAVLFNQFHQIKTAENDTANVGDAKKSPGFLLLKDPFLPTVEWSKFRETFGWLEKNKAAVVASVNGSGATTITDRLAKFISAKPENLLKIHCAPQFDVDFHKKYIGQEDGNGKFQPGILLKFWEMAAAKPDERFVCVLDNFDKINPETFFGPEIWEKLGDPKLAVEFDGRAVEFPSNFYLLSVIHAGVSGGVEFTNEHFRRLGGLHVLEPTALELVEYLRNQKAATEKELAVATDLKKKEKLQAELAALNDTANLTRFVCFFSKTNALLSEKYSVAHQLGQWSNVRKMYKPADFKTLRETFLNHINSLEPSRTLTDLDLADIDYTLKTNGLGARSNFFARQIRFLQDTGYFVEITLIGGTSLVTALAGWWVFRRRERLLRKYGERTRMIFENYEKQELNADEASIRLEAVKNEVDDLVLKRKINYTEALYFLAFIDDKVKRIEFAKNTSETFQDLMNTFLEDDILTEKEYKKLMQFLQSIRHKIPESEFNRFRAEVDRVYGLMN